MKKCTICKKVKDLEDFSPGNAKDGKAAACKDCRNEKYNRRKGNKLDEIAKNAYIFDHYNTNQ